jgi:hypothetical protein
VRRLAAAGGVFSAADLDLEMLETGSEFRFEEKGKSSTSERCGSG